MIIFEKVMFVTKFWGPFGAVMANFGPSRRRHQIQEGFLALHTSRESPGAHLGVDFRSSFRSQEIAVSASGFLIQ